MKKSTFDILHLCTKQRPASQRAVAEATGVSLGTVNKTLRACRDSGWLDETLALTPAGLRALEPYKVKNAVIMAAGLSTRFAPLSYEKPKGLLVVKGEVLIEREIEQLRQAGIRDIVVVVGYMKELFFYLREKYGVEIVVNEDYRRINNPSTLMKVLDRLSNTYVCSSDNYFVDNVFERYVYRAYYSSVYLEDASAEWTMETDHRDRVVRVNLSPVSGWCMMGHVYFDRAFSERFKTLLVQHYGNPLVSSQVWEYLLSQHLDELEIHIRRYDAGRLLEFDSLADLRSFDETYIQNSDSRIFDNICQTLGCAEKEISDITVIPESFSNMSFKFTCRGQDYIYRHPGVGTEKLVSRAAEAYSEEIARELGLDKTYITMDAQRGWKLSRYIPNARIADYRNPEDIRAVTSMIRRLHQSGRRSPYDFDLWGRTERLRRDIQAGNRGFAELDALYEKIEALYRHTQRDNVPKVLNHGDCYAPNFLVDSRGEYYLIDWEYSGNEDPMNDLCEYMCNCDYRYDEVVSIVETYYGRELRFEERRHALAYLSIVSFHWYLWAIYQESQGKDMGAYTLTWFQYAVDYEKIASPLYENEKGAC